MIQTYFRNVLVAQGNSGQQINIKYNVTKAWNNTQSDNAARLTRPADGELGLSRFPVGSTPKPYFHAPRHVYLLVIMRKV